MSGADAAYAATRKELLESQSKVGGTICTRVCYAMACTDCGVWRYQVKEAQDVAGSIPPYLHYAIGGTNTRHKTTELCDVQF
eukprot:2345486-Rhodomonas_salina.3